MLTTQGNPPLATALPIAAAPPVAIAVAMTHFVVARDGPPVATGGEKFHVVYKTAKIVTRNSIILVDTPVFTSALSAFVMFVLP